MVAITMSRKRKVSQFLNDNALNGAKSEVSRFSKPHNVKATLNGKVDWDEEQDYERLTRKTKKKVAKPDSNRLPIKTLEGRIVQLEVDERDVERDAADNDGYELSEMTIQVNEEVDEDNSESLEALAPPKQKKSERQRITEAKEELANIASTINEDPEENYALLRKLQELFEGESSTIIKKLILLTQVSIFRDIIPGYRIRPLSAEEQTVKVTSDVRKLRSFEQALVSHYKNYVDTLGRLSRSGGQLSPIAVSCTCNLLDSVPHFNFRPELLKIIVERLSSRVIDDSFVKCRNTMEDFFKHDESGTGSLEAVRLIVKMLKAKDYRVDESVLNTFLCLRLLTELNVKASYDTIDQPQKMKKKDRIPFTKKERKALKEKKLVDAQMKEADAVVVYEERDKNQSETLKTVFATYFRILREQKPDLMGATLEGLAKFAHLINVEFFADILAALKELVEDAQRETEDQGEEMTEKDESESTQRERNLRREALLCIVSAFSLLADQANEAKGLVNIDLSFFTKYLYSVLLLLSVSPTIELSSKSLHIADPSSPESTTTDIPSSRVNKATEIEMLLRSLDVIFFKAPRGAGEISSTRVAAFTKRLSIATLQLPEKSCIALLTSLQNLSKKHSRKVHTLFVSEDRVGDGNYDPFIDSPELSNSLAGSAVFEHALLANHYSPKVREHSKQVLKSARTR